MKHLRRNPPVFIVMRTAQHPARTNPLCFKTGHAGGDAKFLGRSIGGDHNTIAASPATNPHGTALKSVVERNFAAREKTVAVHMQNSVHFYFSVAAEVTRLKLRRIKVRDSSRRLLP